MLSSHHKLEDFHPEKFSNKEEVAQLLIGIRMLKDLQGCWVTSLDLRRQLRPLIEPIVYSVLFSIGMVLKGAKASDGMRAELQPKIVVKQSSQRS